MDNRRIIYIDNIKAYACIMVVLQHVATYGYIYVGTGAWSDYWVCNISDDSNYIVNVILITIAKTAVPLFVMVNGALMLNKDLSWEKIFSKYIVRCIKILLFWNFFMSICTFMDGGTINDVLSVFVFGYQQFWFLYTLIGLYVMQPLLRAIVKQDNLLKVMIYFFVILSVMETLEVFLPVKLGKNIHHLLELLGFSDMPKWCGYYCLGFYLYKNELNIKISYMFMFCLIALVSVVWSVVMSSKNSIFVLESIEVFTLSTLFISVLIWCLFKRVFNTKYLWSFSIINKESFFIYAIHCLLIEIALSNHISLDLINMFGLEVIIVTIGIICISIMMKTFIINHFGFLKRFCEW